MPALAPDSFDALRKRPPRQGDDRADGSGEQQREDDAPPERQQQYRGAA